MSVLDRHDVALIRADNPGPLTLTGTNAWVVGRDGAWVIDPGPALPAHVEALVAEVERRGGLAGIALTHDHRDHAEALHALRERFGGGAPLAAASATAELRLRDGDRAGPLEAVATPGHAADHLAYVLGPLAFTGDAVLGAGSVFLMPGAGGLAAYLDGLARLRARRLELLCPGHGPLVADPAAKLDEYVAHRRERERLLLDALARGLRGMDQLLDAAWADVPDSLRPVAAVTLAVHLEKLEDEGRLPDDVERPPGWPR